MRDRIEEKVVWEDFKIAVSRRGHTMKSLAAKMGHSHSFFNNWCRRGGFPKRVVLELLEVGIQPEEYNGGDGDQKEKDDRAIEDAFVRALERFYGVKEGEYTRWFITTMNAVTKNACREILDGAEV